MRKRSLQTKKPLTVGQQIYRLRSRFPGFKWKGRGKQIWIGRLQPTPDSSDYQIKIAWIPQSRPIVHVISPTILKDAPHRYGDGSLCLYYPKDGSWTPYHFIADTIIPWTAMWLWFYEAWDVTGEWYGPEVKHDNTD